MNEEQLLKLVKSLRISKEEFTILSSGALVLRGILGDAGDLDIAVSKKGFDELNNSYTLIPKGNNWFIVNDKVECVINDMEGIREQVVEYYIQDINNYLSYIENSAREKDKLRVSLVKKYIKERN